MILDLHIQNFAIIDQLELNFSPGLITFTGETGAGKSIIIDAVEALLGSRVDATMVRTGEEQASIQASFKLPGTSRENVLALLKPEELMDDPDVIVLSREIKANGRSIARINGRIVNVNLLKQVGEYLVDVHGQSEHLSLLRVRQHLAMLDSFAGSEPQLGEYTKTYRRLQDIQRDLAKLREIESEAARRIDMLTFQINEIESARLKPGEEEILVEERNRLANAEGLASLSQEALQILDEGSPESPAASDLLGQVVRAISGLAKLDASQAPLDEQAQNIFFNLSDLIRTLREYLDGIEFNPKRLDQVEERLNLLHTLKRKYGKPGGASIQDILTFAEKAHTELDAITHVEENIQELEKEARALLGHLAVQGAELSRLRQEAAARLEKALEEELTHLSMGGARFKVSFQTRADAQGLLLEDGSRVAYDATGYEQVEFLVAPNPGEGLKPLVKVASGGETSRLMLAIKNVLAVADQVPTLIFDEIDQGIGGRVGNVVGKKLWDLARQHQVLCVTHLPQLAAFGQQHLKVHKALQDGRTSTHVEELNEANRYLELAQMMGEITEGTRKSALELLNSVKDTTRQ